ncbi:MAG TPA: hypothetical protein VE573_13170 [Nitrososphaeraceae archaeon]|nr:hypothetical protein [Nitrososphaeraceae archaeon]
MACEALVIGSVAGLALTAGLLSFRVLTDRSSTNRRRKKDSYQWYYYLLAR